MIPPPLRPAAPQVKSSSRGARARPRSWLAACLAASLACGCHHDPLPVAPGEPIPAEPEVTLGTMDTECDGLLEALASYKACRNLDDDDRRSIEAFIENAQQDFAAGKKARPEPNAQHAIAAACHKAITSVTAANERCHAGPKPKI